jgi:hypothetical protein
MVTLLRQHFTNRVMWLSPYYNNNIKITDYKYVGAYLKLVLKNLSGLM